MKSETLKNALNAHGWVGLIISLPLFIVFWAGAITFFHAEIDQWAKLPYYDIDTKAKASGNRINYNHIVEEQIRTHSILPGERISVRFPNDKMPYLRMYFQVPIAPAAAAESADVKEAQQQIKKEYKDILVDPYSGEVFTEHSPFELSNFIYQLHYNLRLPQGLYIVGLITLFFFVIIITGVVVQLKNLVKNFFLYRKDQNTRSQMNDMHNVVGVISLPYAIMYALTGVILNLLILVQIPSALLLYNGDTDAIAQDAGFYNHRGEASGESYPMPDLSDFAASLAQQNDAEVTGLNLFGYGDKSAVIQAIGIYNTGFNQAFTRYYQVVSDSYPDDMNLPEDNAFSTGLLMLYSMHFANFAGTDMRLIYFVLAMAFCAMIVAGNVLWVVKRQQKNAYPKTLAFTRGATLGACIGVITATAFAFLLERTLPEATHEREHVIEYAFGLTLLLITIAGFFAKKLRPFIGVNLIASSALLALTVIFEWLVLGQTMTRLISNGYYIPGYVSAGLLLTAIILLATAVKVLKYQTSPAENHTAMNN
ncbi:PepSY-associated TM helix domain-containing protein [Planctobacterium marinum]|uniref:PepSY-associated TM helix domain-containing protein n=1 Tax=Planctobacterium marinum TaxID=1631968 RepID=UPI001E32DEA8|nr:PepSY-associated TM helix domain-containing protein [Planctobacterium marinum]MCC2607463.1 PepSY domain-containing protein [Planctobacterium marinum]